MDEGSETTILNLLRQDVMSLQGQQKGKQAPGTVTDFEMALQTFEAGLNQSENSRRDRQVAISMAEQNPAQRRVPLSTTSPSDNAGGSGLGSVPRAQNTLTKPRGYRPTSPGCNPMAPRVFNEPRAQFSPTPPGISYLPRLSPTSPGISYSPQFSPTSPRFPNQPGEPRRQGEQLAADWAGINNTREKDKAPENEEATFWFLFDTNKGVSKGVWFPNETPTQTPPGNVSCDVGVGSSANSQHRDSTPGHFKYKCVACFEMEPESDTMQMGCGHRYCVKCIIKIFEDSLSNEYLFPPRCCRIGIPLFYVRGVLGKPLASRVEEKEVEFRDPSRTYCANTDCLSYIPPEPSQKYVRTCKKCQTQTCAWCKKTAHSGTCPEDPEAEKVIEQAKVERWQRCYRCKAMVELQQGCYHIR
ncbi:hypothetical protein FQN54_009853 [Arachnomyces sp. PD_36]|nr:hypothetical protein FQN54_009853 [Arachnomyces sp. PD_36]